MSERSSRLQEQLEQLGAHHQQIYGTPPSRNSMLSVRKGLFTGIQQRKSTDLRAAAFASEARGEGELYGTRLLVTY
ncbi:hypothetical protein ID866_2090 [Astraeus odoratus]|nr:hypothetical protein ID866_2090 [Astraeus odoratus]